MTREKGLHPLQLPGLLSCVTDNNQFRLVLVTERGGSGT